MSDLHIKTRFCILSDTHGEQPQIPIDEAFDVAIHCGDLTEGSKLQEFKTTINLMKQIQAPLKLIIAGNHDWTLDTPVFKHKISEIPAPIDMDLVRREYGDFGQARNLLEQAKDYGIVFLDQGTHNFALANGASLKVYASPYTPSTNDWGFQYHPSEGHPWQIEPNTDVVITHGPPHGILDYVRPKRAGCPSLFAAIARARPRMHCFGHIHSSWGAKYVAWKPLTDSPSHFTDIDNDRSGVVETLSGLTKSRFDTDDVAADKAARLQSYLSKGYCTTRHNPVPADSQGASEDMTDGHGINEIFVNDGSRTLFINAAVKGSEEMPWHPAWVVDLDLPRA